MSENISTIVGNSLALFSTMIRSYTELYAESEIPLSLWSDERGRLRVWVSNIGAHQTGPWSLEYRLRDAPRVRQQAVRLLKRLHSALKDLQHLDNEFGPPPWPHDSEGPDEIRHIYESVVDTITELYQLSMMIRKPPQNHHYLGIEKQDIKKFEHWDHTHVRNKFPKAAEYLVQRLGTAISRRRAVRQYRERHRAKLSSGLEDDADEKISLSETTASKFSEDIDGPRESVGSVTSYGDSLYGGSRGISIPPAPKGSGNGSPFECPYCFCIISIGDNPSWVRHVFTDLVPYTCILADCPDPTHMYIRRREWLAHLQNAHEFDFGISHDCPLCHDMIEPGNMMQRHLGRHLLELALFAIPRTDQEETDSQEGLLVENIAEFDEDMDSINDIQPSGGGGEEEDTAVGGDRNLPPHGHNAADKTHDTSDKPFSTTKGVNMVHQTLEARYLKANLLLNLLKSKWPEDQFKVDMRMGRYRLTLPAKLSDEEISSCTWTPPWKYDEE